MAETNVNTSGDADMTDGDGEKVVTMLDVLQEQEEFEEDANAVLGASDDKECTFSKGYIRRQAVYACLTCCSEAKEDPAKRAGVCLACCLNCHENHELVELYTKRNFRCDCGNPKFGSSTCQFTPDKPELNHDNSYNQNFSGLYCICHRPYPDPDPKAKEEDMIQCIICEDWLHASHLEAVVPDSEQYTEMICKGCLDKNVFLHDYSQFAVLCEDLDVTSDSINDSLLNGDSEKILNDTADPEILEIELSKSAEPVGVITNGKSDEDLDVIPKKSFDLEEPNTPNIVSTTEVTQTKQDSKVEHSENTTVEIAFPETTSLENQESKIVDSESSENASVEIAFPETTTLENQESKIVDSESSTAEIPCSETTTFENQENKIVTSENFSTEISSSETSAFEPVDKEENKEQHQVAINENTVIPLEADNSVTNNLDLKEPPTPENLLTEETLNKTEESNISEKNIPLGNEHETSIHSKTGSADRNDETVVDDEKSQETSEEFSKEINELAIENGLEDSVHEKNVSAIDDVTQSEKCFTDTNSTTTNEVNGFADIKMTEINGAPIPVENTHVEKTINENKRKYSTEDDLEDISVKKAKLIESTQCKRPQDVKKVFKGASFWPSNFRQKLCTCNECISMYKDLSVLFLTDLEDTVSAYETLGKEKTDGAPSTQYEKGLQALSSLDRTQQINALTEYNNMRDKLLDYLKSFKDRKEIVKEEDIKAFFAGMKPKREPDGVYFCR